jgi:uncharacterized membrane protein
MSLAVSSTSFDLRHALYRLGFVGAAVLLIDKANELQYNGRSPFLSEHIWWSIGLFLFVLVLLVIALLPKPYYRLSWLILGAALVNVLLAAHLEAISSNPLFSLRTDNEMIARYAVEALKRGENPYLWDFSDMLRVFRNPGNAITYFLDNSMQNRLTYPIMPTLLLYVLDVFGIGEVNTVSVIFLLLLYVIMFAGTAETYRPIILLPLLVLHQLNFMVLHGMQDTLWSFLLVAMIFAWKKPILRAVLFGLAVNYRQQPWFVLAFLLLMIWQEEGSIEQRLKRAGLFAGISGMMFAAFNLPYILWDFRSWALSVFEPMYASFNVLSQGVGTLSQYGLVTLPKTAYTVAQFTFYAGALIVYARHPRQLGQMFWIVPAVFFWLYYRGLGNYWLLWLPPLLIAVTQWLPNPVSVLVVERQRWRRTAIFASSLLALNVAVFTYYQLQPDPVSLVVLSPSYTAPFASTEVDRLSLRVTNNSSRILRPRFSVQMDQYVELYPWRIESGREQLMPDESADYVISADWNARKMFSRRRGAQVVLTDAGGDYWLRAVADVSVTSGYQQTGGIYNTDFRYWEEGARLPQHWALAPDQARIAASIREVDGQQALVADSSAADGLTRLSQSSSFPDMLRATVYPPASGGDTMLQPYGIEINSGGDLLWILFAEEAAQGAISEEHHYVVVESTPERWQQHEIDIEALYRRLSLDIPDYDFDARSGRLRRPITISLLIPAGVPQVAYGAVETDCCASTVDELIASPELYYALVGESYARDGNRELALQAYLNADTYVDTRAQAQASDRRLLRTFAPLIP